MNILILNWSQGENDPFTYFNKLLAKNFEALGRNPIIVNLDSDFDKNMNDAISKGIDFCITWQGIGSDIKQGAENITIWEYFKIPLFCLHGDHPCHKPIHHQDSSNYLQHLYATPSMARFANHNINRIRPALFVNMPNFFKGNFSSEGNLKGDYFILPKNLDDTTLTLNTWEAQFSKKLYKYFFEIADAIKGEINFGNLRDHHKIIDTMLNEEFFDALKDQFKVRDEIALRYLTHQVSDKLYRNLMSEHILSELADVRVKIFGRGWGRFSAINNKNHEFLAFNNAMDGDFQFQSQYGIIDVPPICDSLHDRTLRAASKQCGFVIGSSWNHQEFLGADFSNLFYTGKENDLREKAEMVMRDPLGHKQLASEFDALYKQNFSFYRFLKDLEILARHIND
jgi:hypothetical protein